MPPQRLFDLRLVLAPLLHPPQSHHFLPLGPILQIDQLHGRGPGHGGLQRQVWMFLDVDFYKMNPPFIFLWEDG